MQFSIPCLSGLKGLNLWKKVLVGRVILPVVEIVRLVNHSKFSFFKTTQIMEDIIINDFLATYHTHKEVAVIS